MPPTAGMTKTVTTAATEEAQPLRKGRPSYELQRTK